MLAQDTPNLIGRYIAQGTGNQRAVPSCVPRWRGVIELAEDTALGLLVVDRRLAGARSIGQTSQTMSGKTGAPLAHHGGLHLVTLADHSIAPPFLRGHENTPALHL